MRKKAGAGIMNWKEFKEEVESQGVHDYDELWYIDVGNPTKGFIRVERFSNGTVRICCGIGLNR